MIILDNSLWELWKQKVDFTITQTIFIGLFFLICGLVLCAANWYIQVGIIAEFGYPKRSKREKRNGNMTWVKQFRPISRIFLWRPCSNAQRKGVILWLAWLCNLFKCAFRHSVLHRLSSGDYYERGRLADASCDISAIRSFYGCSFHRVYPDTHFSSLRTAQIWKVRIKTSTIYQ